MEPKDTSGAKKPKLKNPRTTPLYLSRAEYATNIVIFGQKDRHAINGVIFSQKDHRHVRF